MSNCNMLLLSTCNFCSLCLTLQTRQIRWTLLQLSTTYRQRWRKRLVLSMSNVNDHFSDPGTAIDQMCVRACERACMCVYACVQPITDNFPSYPYLMLVPIMHSKHNLAAVSEKLTYATFISNCLLKDSNTQIQGLLQDFPHLQVFSMTVTFQN